MSNMKWIRCNWEKCLSLLAVVCVAFLVVGCAPLQSSQGTNAAVTGTNGAETNPEVDFLSVGDKVRIEFSNTLIEIKPHEEQIKDDGTINLALIGDIKAAGKTVGEVQREIQKAYVPTYYVRLTVTVTPADRFYYVGGEVKQPNRFPYVGGITVLRAIQSAGDFTDFAKKKKVRLIRAKGKIEFINAVKARENPALDLPVFPGDKIDVDRSL